MKAEKIKALLLLLISLSIFMSLSIVANATEVYFSKDANGKNVKETFNTKEALYTRQSLAGVAKYPAVIYYERAKEWFNKITDEEDKKKLSLLMDNAAKSVYNDLNLSIIADIDELSKTGSAKIYDNLRNKINGGNLPSEDKKYFLTKVTSLGDQLVFTEDYNKANAAVKFAWDYYNANHTNDDDVLLRAIDRAEPVVENVENTYSKAYLKEQLQQMRDGLVDWVCPQITSYTTGDLKQDYETVGKALGIKYHSLGLQYFPHGPTGTVAFMFGTCTYDETRNCEYQLDIKYWVGSQNSLADNRIRPIAQQVLKFFFNDNDEMFNYVDNFDTANLKQYITVGNRQVYVRYMGSTYEFYIGKENEELYVPLSYWDLTGQTPDWER